MTGDGLGSAAPRAQLDWRGAVPVSRRHGDAYFGDADGLAEARHVFLEGVDLPALWRGSERFTVAETGFGSGLNFLALWHLWRAAGRGVRLDMVSVEGFPMTAEEAVRARAPWPELAPLSRALRDAWPPLAPGWHRLCFEDGAVTLTLAVGPVEGVLAEVEARVDAWFLDGFAPARNPEMWTDGVFRHVARLSAPGARLASFTTAGAVRRGLEAVGFEVHRRPGHGRKRENLMAVLSRRPARPAIAWDAPPRPTPPGPAVVLGGGIAGAAVAHALARRGRALRLVDPGGPAAGASGNPLGVVMPPTSLQSGPRASFHETAFRQAAALCADLGEAVGFDGAGVLQPARDLGGRERLARLADADRLPTPGARVLGEEAVNETAGVTVNAPGLWMPEAGCVDPRALCRALWADAEPQDAVSISGREDGWAVRNGAGAVLADAAVVVLAAGPDCARFLRWLPLVPRRGQVTTVAATPESLALRTTLAAGPYLCPARDGAHLLGATFDPPTADADWEPVLEADHDRNLRAVADLLPALAPWSRDAVLAGRAAVRATTPDRLPIAGPVPDADLYRAAFAGLRGRGPRGETLAAPPWRPGYYVLTGLGARGLTTAPILGELIADMVSGTPWPLPRTAVAAVHPARVLTRAIRHGRAP